MSSYNLPEYFYIVYSDEVNNSCNTNRCKNLNGDESVNRAWDNIKENIKTSAKDNLGLHEWKQHKPWFDKECVDFLDQRKQAKMQWIQDPSQSNVDNLNNINNNNNIYLLQLGCYPVAVVILHVNKHEIGHY